MRQQIKWWWDSIGDAIDDAGEWVQANLMRLAMGVILLLGILSGASLLLDELGPGMVIETRQIQNQIFLTWEAPRGGALIYEIQGRAWGGDWQSFAWSPFPYYHLAIPPGVASFRVRPWTKAGAGDWSAPSEYFIFSVPPDIFEEEGGAEAAPA